MVPFLSITSGNIHNEQAVILKLLYIYLFMNIFWCFIPKIGHSHKKFQYWEVLFQLSIKYFLTYILCNSHPLFHPAEAKTYNYFFFGSSRNTIVYLLHFPIQNIVLVYPIAKGALFTKSHSIYESIFNDLYH